MVACLDSLSAQALLQRQLLPSFKLLCQSSPDALQLKPSKASKCVQGRIDFALCKLTHSACNRAMDVSGLKLSSVETGFKGQKLGQVKLDLALMTLKLVLKFVHLYKHHQGTA